VTHWIVWNNAKTEGFATTDQQLAYEVRKGTSGNYSTSNAAEQFGISHAAGGCTTEEVPSIQPYIVEGLRALRLHHWKGVLEFSKRIAHYEARLLVLKDARQIERAREGLLNCKKSHSFQMKQVQLLNDFFPIGDTAEHDNATDT
jgi:hypothetical protein